MFSWLHNYYGASIYTFLITAHQCSPGYLLHIGHSYLTHSLILRKEEAPVCDACNTVLTAKHIMIECADLLEVRNKYFRTEVFVFTLSECEP